MRQSAPPVAQRQKYKCNACNWKFSRNFTPQLCPYCGKEAVVIDAPKNADDILREVEEIRI